MIIFAAAVLALLALAAILSRKLSRPADTLGLRAARAAVVADMHRRVSRDSHARRVVPAGYITREESQAMAAAIMSDRRIFRRSAA